MNLAQTITTLAPSPVLSLAAALLLFFAAEGIGRGDGALSPWHDVGHLAEAGV